MKVIDLLNKIANEKEIPKKIRYDNTIFNLVINDFGSIYCRNEYGEDLYDAYNIYKILNDEVEIIEDNKKIGTLDLDWADVLDFKEQAQQDCVKMVFNKINEIIDKINKMED